MKNKIHSMFLVLSLTAGLMAITSCSKSDDERSASEQPANGVAANEYEPLTQAKNNLNSELSGLNFQDLAPLYQSVKAYESVSVSAPNATRGTNGVADDFFAAFNSTLGKLLEALRNFNVELPYGQRFTYQSFNDALQLSWDVSGILIGENTSGSLFFGNTVYGKGEATYTASDGNVYNITAESEKDYSIYDWKIYVNKARLLVIKKNGEQVLKIVTGSERARRIYNPFNTNGSTFTGEVIYKDYDITLSCERESTHERHVDITYAKVGSDEPLLVMSTIIKDDANIVKLIKHDITFSAEFTITALNGVLNFVGTVDNVNYLVVDGVKLKKLMEDGTTSKEECDKVVSNFNSHMTLKMSLSDSVDLGTLFMGTVFDSEHNVYKPTVMVNSQLFGNQDYVLTDILKMLGVNMDGILQAAEFLDD